MNDHSVGRADAAGPGVRARRRNGLRRGVAALGAGALVAGSCAGILAWTDRRRASPGGDGAAVAIASEHLRYESDLMQRELPRLAPDAATVIDEVRSVTDSLDTTLSSQLSRLGLSAGRAQALWKQQVGDGSPANGGYALSCSLHRQQSDAADLAATPADALPTELAEIELTLFAEGRQLAGDIRSAPALRRSIDDDQREAMHHLAPLLIPTDRAYAASA